MTGPSPDPRSAPGPDGAPEPHGAPDVAGFVARVRAELPEDRVLTEASALVAFGGDRSEVAPRPPAVVVHAESPADVQLVVRSARASGLVVIARGLGSGLAGGVVAGPDAVVVTLDRMQRILDLDPVDAVAVVEPGVVNSVLGEAAAAHGLMFAPDPASWTFSTVGGNIATNAGGLRSAKYGVTRDSVLALDVVLADGSLVSLGHRTRKDVAGLDLVSLVVGSEGTLAIVVGATLRLHPLPVDVVTLAAFFDDVPLAAEAVAAIGSVRVQPAVVELLDRGTLADLDDRNGTSLSGRGGALLLVQTDGWAAEAEADAVRGVLAEHGGRVSEPGDAEAEHLVEWRRTARPVSVDRDYQSREDVAVPRSRLVEAVRGIEEIAERHGVALTVVAHAGDGNLHPSFRVRKDSVDGDPAAVADALSRLRSAGNELVALALALGGTMTGEHGIGLSKRRWLDDEFSPEVRALHARVKAAFDPDGLLNPGKAI